MAEDVSTRSSPVSQAHPATSAAPMAPEHSSQATQKRPCQRIDSLRTSLLDAPEGLVPGKLLSVCSLSLRTKA